MCHQSLLLKLLAPGSAVEPDRFQMAAAPCRPADIYQSRISASGHVTERARRSLHLVVLARWEVGPQTKHIPGSDLYALYNQRMISASSIEGRPLCISRFVSEQVYSFRVVTPHSDQPPDSVMHKQCQGWKTSILPSKPRFSYFLGVSNCLRANGRHPLLSVVLRTRETGLHRSLVRPGRAGTH